MPVWNGGGYLREAVEGVLEQEGVEVELLVCDDGSMDGSGEWLEAVAQADERVRLVRQGNLGVVAALNRLVGMARGKFLARMDADDVMVAGRLARQAGFLQEHPAVGVVGGWVETIGEDGELLGEVRYAAEAGAVESGLVFRNTLAHPAVMMRAEIFSPPTGRTYDVRHKHVEDYGLWMGVSGRWGLANVPEVVLRYRLHEDSVGSRHAREQERASVSLQLGFIKERLGVEATEAERRVHWALAFDRLDPTPQFCGAAMGWLRKLAGANRERLGEKRGFAGEAFLRVLTGRYVAVVRKAREAGVGVEERGEPFGAYMHAGAV